MKIVPAALTCLSLLCLSMLPLSSTHAARIDDPYTVEIPVASQNMVDRPAAERAGLLLVLEKLSGQRLDGDPHVKSALAKAENYLQQFAYTQDNPASQDKPASQEKLASQDKPVASAVAQPAWRMKLVFSPAAVNQLLDEAGVALWPLDRPRVMLLMVNEQAALLPLPAAGSADAIATLVRTGQARGVPLLVPDPAEQDITVAADVQALDSAALMPQAIKQKADALLLGNIRGSDATGWSGQWLLHFQDQDQSFQQKAATFKELVDAALRQTAVCLSGSYLNSTTIDTGPAQLRLQVDGVRTYAAYMQLRQYLEKLEAVKSVGATQINGTTVIVDVDVKGRESFRSLTSLFKSLQWQEEVLPPPGSDPSLRTLWHYQWVQ